MYKTYKVNLDEIRNTVSTYKLYGQKQSSEMVKAMEPGLTQYLNANGVLDGQKIMDDWFPKVDADIFISHSHRDDNDIHALAGWLKMNLGLTSFIDADVWGYCNDLIKEMYKSCYPDTKNNYAIGPYNEITAHVHNMLMSALSKMIDKCECLIFVDSDQSISARETAKKTRSPWIYNELLLSSMIKPRIPQRKAVRIQDSRIILEQRDTFAMEFRIDYPAVLKHMKQLSLPTLNMWVRQFKAYKVNYTYRQFALDLLYDLTK